MAACGGSSSTFGRHDQPFAGGRNRLHHRKHRHDAAPATNTSAGASFHTCLTYLAAGGITKVAYTGTDDYTSSPVAWSAGG